MKIEDALSNEALLRQNHAEIKQEIPPTLLPDENLSNCLWRMPTTHTFGYEKMIPLLGDASKIFSIYPYKKILFDDKALLSDKYRRTRDKKHEDDIIRTMTKARSYGLDNYIFTYLGTHEYYYAKCRGANVPPFGIFLSVKLDYEENANSTFYDLESRYVGNRTPSQITLNTVDARDLTAYEVVNKYENDFFNYWICKNYVSKRYFDNNMWELKREFHYHEKIDLSEITAIIWPVEKGWDQGLNQFVVREHTQEELAEFRTSHKGIAIYTYEWNEPEGLYRFQYASFLIADYFYKKGKLPNTDIFADLFLKAFPGW